MHPRSLLALALPFLTTAFVATAVVPSAHASNSGDMPRSVSVPTEIGEGEGKEVKVLVDADHLKLATIILRDGTSLPTHSTPVPATIQVLEGDGVIHVLGKPVAVEKGSVVVLAAGEEHDVVPRPESDMLLLVHYLRTAKADGHSGHGAHDHQH